MTHAEQLKEIFDALRDAGRCTSKKEFAALVGVNYSTIVNAMAGRERYSSDKLVARAKQVLNEQGASVQEKAPTPKEVVVPAETLELYNHLSRTIEKQAEIIAALLGEKQQKKKAE